MTEDLNTPDELTVLKERATMMNISFHPSIGLEKLREKVNAAMQNQATQEETPMGTAEATVDVAESPAAKRKRMMDDAMRLVRIRVTCMNPAKSEWPGEIISIGNNLVGTVKKYIPFNAEEGWHVPNILYQVLKERQCQIFVKGKTKNGVTFRQGKLIKEFAIEVLDPLTKEELHDLAQRQAMSGSIAA